jgi:hypothetical protein
MLQMSVEDNLFLNPPKYNYKYNTYESVSKVSRLSQ